MIGSPRQVLFASLPALTEFGLAPGAVQENLLLSDWVETLPSGAVVQLGAQAQVRLTFLCEPCASLERLKPGLSRQIHGKRGMLGMVVRDGVVCPGDEVRMLPLCLPALSDKPSDRLNEFVARIPLGRIVRTRDLLLALGLTPSYARAIPALLKKSPHLPVHRIVAADGDLLSRHTPNQEALLAAEGVAVAAGRVEPAFSWNPMEFHDLGPDGVESG
jgi:alkylated DNA nucleotide flippase Atl1